MHKPESSDITGKFTNFEKKFAFNFELDLNDLPVSFGLLIFNLTGDIFLNLFDNK